MSKGKNKKATKAFQSVLSNSGEITEEEIDQSAPKEKKFISYKTQDEILELNRNLNFMDAALGGWFYAADKVKIDKFVSLIVSGYHLGNPALPPPEIRFCKFGRKTYGRFIKGYTASGAPTSTIELNSFFWDNCGLEYQKFWVLLHELIHWHFWTKTVEHHENKAIRHGKKFQEVAAKFGLTVDARRGILVSAGIADNGKFLFRDLLCACGVDCPKEITCEIDLADSPKAKKENKKDKKIAELEKELADVKAELKKILDAKSSEMPLTEDATAMESVVVN